MDAARLAAVEAAFHAGLEVEPERLDAFLDARCASDPSLRQEVEALLAAHRRAGGFIDTPVMKLDERLFDTDEDADRLVGTTIGHWEILKHVGSGGMGAVYLARRADRQFEQQAALKLIKRGMDTDAVLRRFRNERQILAGLDHPNIARLLDGDTTADGLPYFVMEYVEGLPIDAYCERHALPVDARLRLFREVCAAVSHAHRHAVIHRDLKPSNILVSGDGVPKLLDFGIARLVQPGGTPEAAATMMELRALTPEYASPEQVRGDPVTTASDVYSLGVVLYRLLTGELPDGGMAHTTEGGPRPRRLRGDLHNIVMMALRQEPERRYASVDQLSEDIRRHLGELPVLARRDTLGYRAGKFIRRNTAASVAATLVILSLVGGIVATSWQAKRARAQEAIALAEKAKAEHRFNEVRQLARAVIFDYHDAIDMLPGATAVRERLLKDGLAYLDSLASEAAGDPALQRELATAYDRLGDVSGATLNPASLGDVGGAMDSYRKALRLREALDAAAPGDLQNRRDLAESHLNVGVQFVEMGDAAQGIKHLRKAVAIYGALVAGPADSFEIRTELAAAIDSLGLSMEDIGNPRAALEIHRQAQAVREALIQASPGNMKLRRGLVLTDINIGRALYLGGDFEGALASNRRGLTRAEALVAEEPDHANNRRFLANTWQNDGDYRATLGDIDGAVLSFRNKLVLDEQALAADPKNANARSDLAYTHRRLGFLYGEAGRHDEALTHYRLALDEYENTRAESSDAPNSRVNVILARAGAAEMLAHRGEHAEALAESMRALEQLDWIAPNPASWLSSSLRGQVYMQVAAAYAVLGADTSLDVTARREHWGAARELFGRSLAVWQDMQARGILTAEDAAKPQELTAAMARCAAALRQLSA